MYLLGRGKEGRKEITRVRRAGRLGSAKDKVWPGGRKLRARAAEVPEAHRVPLSDRAAHAARPARANGPAAAGPKPAGTGCGASGRLSALRPCTSLVAATDHRPGQRGEGAGRAGRLRGRGGPREPLLVVPTLPDVDRYRRELAARGLVFGARVLTAEGLVRELARRAGLRERPLGALARERVAAAAIARTALPGLGASARTPGFLPRAAGARRRARRAARRARPVDRALRAWAAGGARPRRLRRGARRALPRLRRRARAHRPPRRGPPRRRRARRAAHRSRALGRHPRAALRLRRPHRAPARRGRDARGARRRRGHRLAALRAGPRGVRRQRADLPGAARARRRADGAPGAPGLRGAGAPPPRAPALRARRGALGRTGRGRGRRWVR